MSEDGFLVRRGMDVVYPNSAVGLTLLSASRLSFEMKEAPFARTEIIAIHGRIRGWEEAPRIVVDIFRAEDGGLAAHRDVLQAEVPAAAGATGLASSDPGEGAERARSAP